MGTGVIISQYSAIGVSFMIVFRVVKKLNSILSKRQRIDVVKLLNLMIVAGFAEMLSVSLVLPFVSILLNPELIASNDVYARVADFLKIDNEKWFVVLYAVFLAIMYILKNLFLIYQANRQYKFVYNNMIETQCKLLHSFLKKPYESFLSINSGEVVRIINNDTSGTYDLVTNLLLLFSETFVSVTLGVTLFCVSPLITTAISLLMIVLVLLVGIIIRPRLISLTKKNQIATANMTKWLLQSIQGIKEVKVMQKEVFFEGEYRKNGTINSTTTRQRLTLMQIPRFMIEAISMSAILVMIALLVMLGSNIVDIMPVLAAMAVAAVRLLPSFNRISQGLNSLSAYEPYLDKTIDNLKEICVNFTDDEVCNSDKSLSKIDEYRLNRVSYHYPNRISNVLTDITFEIKRGQRVGIVGLSGAGKTTLLDIMLGLLKPNSGSVEIDGIDLEKNKQGWLSRLAYIPQSVFLLDGSVRENVAFGIDEKLVDEEQVKKAIKEAALDEYVSALPDGLDTQLGERGVRLSGGQRQRIGIARALYTNPEVLFLDEATSALDSETEAEIMQTINNLKGNRTIIFVTHRLQTLANFDAVYSIKDGKIVNERK